MDLLVSVLILVDTLIFRRLTKMNDNVLSRKLREFCALISFNNFSVRYCKEWFELKQ